MPKMKLPKLCTPKDAKPIYRKEKIGGWLEMEFDASVERHGLTWLHVKDGMGGHGDREDWICDLPFVAISIHDYNWNKNDPFGEKLGRNFDEAVLSALRGSIERTQRDRKELANKLVECDKAISMLESVVKVPAKKASKKK